jgi:hypothetical protein
MRSPASSKHVFDDQRFGMAELINALDHDWAGREEMRRTFATKDPALRQRR